MNSDSPIVEEVRRRAMAISEQYGHDLRKYVEHLRQIQAENASRVVSQLTVVRAETGERT
jgi:phosphoserine phosphatase